MAQEGGETPQEGLGGGSGNPRRLPERALADIGDFPARALLTTLDRPRT